VQRGRPKGEVRAGVWNLNSQVVSTESFKKNYKSQYDMAHLYVTTDAFEAEKLIEDTEHGQEPKHQYNDIESQHGESLVEKLGFNPMCSVEMNGSVSARELDSVATKLVKEELYVATEMNGSVQKYIPKDAEARSDLVKLAMQKKYGRRFGVEPAFYLLRYSNNPNEIREFDFF